MIVGMSKVTLSNGTIEVETDDVVRAIFRQKGADEKTRTVSLPEGSQMAGTKRSLHHHPSTEPADKVKTDTLWIERKRPKEPIEIKGESAEKDAHTLDDALKKSATNTLRVKVDFNFLKKQK
jgi:hypothetical protein